MLGLKLNHVSRVGGVWESFYSRTLTPSVAVVHKVKIHFFLYFFVRPSFGRQFVIRLDGCCANCDVGLAFLPSGHTTWKQRHYDVRNDAITTSCARWVGLRGRARHLFFPQLGSRTTIKQYGLVRNRNVLGHYDKILPFSINNRGELYISIFNFLFQDYCDAHCHIINHWCSSLECVFLFLSILTSQGPGIHFNGYKTV